MKINFKENLTLRRMASEINSYYFTENLDCLKGVRPGTGDIISILGPFDRFDKKTRILYTERNAVYLPENQIEPSKIPNLFERTRAHLQKLIK